VRVERERDPPAPHLQVLGAVVAQVPAARVEPAGLDGKVGDQPSTARLFAGLDNQGLHAAQRVPDDIARAHRPTLSLVSDPRLRPPFCRGSDGVRGEGAQQRVEGLAGVLEPLGSDAPPVVGLDIGDDAAGSADRLPAGFGETDQLRASIARVGGRSMSPSRCFASPCWDRSSPTRSGSSAQPGRVDARSARCWPRSLACAATRRPKAGNSPTPPACGESATRRRP
jgi:hypothetical protein